MLPGKWDTMEGVFVARQGKKEIFLKQCSGSENKNYRSGSGSLTGKSGIRIQIFDSKN